MEEKRVFNVGEKRVEVESEDLEYILKGMRPRAMDYEDFKEIRRILKKELKQYLKGTVVHLSKVSDEVWREYTKGKNIKQRGQTYVKKEHSGVTDDKQ